MTHNMHLIILKSFPFRQRPTDFRNYRGSCRHTIMQIYTVVARAQKYTYISMVHAFAIRVYLTIHTHTGTGIHTYTYMYVLCIYLGGHVRSYV